MVGRFISFKFLDCYGDNGNVDVGGIGVIGLIEEKIDVHKELMGSIADELGVLPPRKKLINNLDEDTIPFIEASKSVVV